MFDGESWGMLLSDCLEWAQVENMKMKWVCSNTMISRTAIAFLQVKTKLLRVLI
jgi:hypothetical protein